MPKSFTVLKHHVDQYAAVDDLAEVGGDGGGEGDQT